MVKLNQAFVYDISIVTHELNFEMSTCATPKKMIALSACERSAVDWFTTKVTGQLFSSAAWVRP
ncbi:hypothetical protein HJFPF1_07730 [Paramyrothecium foliicola]|nr:hypothetical protein HJFPF1_07730 [Paramyrothecium foliicola]